MLTLFISDLHLSADRPEKLELFFTFLTHARAKARTLYILGDLFEIWLGDDDDSPAHKDIQKALKTTKEAGVQLLIMRGNRDFLFGERFATTCGATLLPDEFVTHVGGEKTLLTHGDLLCTKDIEYQAFRKYVRDPNNQQTFLAHTLEERREIAAQTRSGTTASMLEKDDFIMDVDADTVSERMRKHKVSRLIHGHTHRPATHQLAIDGQPCERYVLGDWYEKDNVLVVDGKNLDPMRITDFLSIAS